MGQIYIVLVKYLPIKYICQAEVNYIVIEISQQNNIKIL